MKPPTISQEMILASSQYSKEETYWLNRLAGELDETRFPYDQVSSHSTLSPYETQSQDEVIFQLPGEVYKKLMWLSSDSLPRVHIILAACLLVLIKKYSYRDSIDCIVGAPVYKQNIKGDFINKILILRNPVRDDMMFKELLGEVKQTVLDAVENQNYPFELLVNRLNIISPDNGSSLLDIFILIENIQDKNFIRELEPNIVFSFSHESDTLQGKLEFNPDMYNRFTAERIVSHFQVILSSGLFKMDTLLKDINILSEQEKETLVIEFNRTEYPFPGEKTIHEIFKEQVEKYPDRIATVSYESHVTYCKLNEKSNCLTGSLRENGIETGSIVALRIDRSIEMLTCIMGILKAGCVYLPIDPGLPEERIDFMLKDAGVSVSVVSVSEIPPAVNLFVEEYYVTEVGLKLSLGGDENRYTISNDSCNAQTQKTDTGTQNNTKLKTQNSKLKCAPANTCYIIYTSGTTGKPKGVVVTHRNVIRLVTNTNYIDFQVGDRLLQTGALEFDASTFEIWGSLLNGLTLFVSKKEDIINPVMLKQIISRCRIHIMWLTSSLFNAISSVDVTVFNGLTHILVGGDILSPRHINRVKQAFPSLRVINGYGPTENTTFSTTFPVDRLYEDRIPIGRPISNSTAYIVDRTNRLVPIGIVGELWVGGEGVSLGYLNNPELTSEKFVPVSTISFSEMFPLHFITDQMAPHTVGQKSPLMPYTLYKTGDLSRWLPDGNIEFFGRKDSQVKIRGFRIELGEIENRLLSHEKVKDAVVTIREDQSGDKFIIAYYTGSEKPDEALLKTFLAKDLPSYMIPSYIIQLEKIPLNSNGKVDRKALPAPESEHISEYCAPTNEVEERLISLWSDILNIEDKIGIDHNFFNLGGHSLKATMLISRMHKELDVKVPLAEFFNFPTIRSLAGYIMSQSHKTHEVIPPLEDKEFFPLSSAQKRLFILNRLDSQGTGYNIPFVSLLEGEINLIHLKNIFWQLIARHESFRTSFHLLDDLPVQKTHNLSEICFDIEYDEDKSDNTRAIISKFIRAFDLSSPPLLRVGLIKKASTQYILMVDMHHIISDGSSVAVLVNDFLELYKGSELPALHLQYRDFAGWQNRLQHEESTKKQESFWLNEFADDIPVLELPADFTRPPVQCFDGEKQIFEVDSTKTRALKNIAEKENSTLFMILLSVFSTFLSKLSNQDDIVIGTPAAGRNHSDLEKMIGMFVNTLAIRLHPDGTKSFHEFLREVKEKTLEVFDNQDYQYDDLVEKVITVRDISRNPLFDVMFSMQNIDIKEIKIPGLTFSPFDYKSTISKFDMVFSCTDVDGRFLFSVEYATRLFKHETITRFIDYFINTLSAVIANDPSCLLLSDIDVLSNEEKKKILFDFNNSDMDYPCNKTLHGLFEDQVEKTPDCIAVIGVSLFRDYFPATGNESVSILPGVQITYRGLNDFSDRLARQLIEQGIGPETVVALMVERSAELVIGMMGILKAGSIYLPIDPGLPEERIDFMLKDAEVSVSVVSVREMPPAANLFVKRLDQKLLIRGIENNNKIAKSFSQSAGTQYSFTQKQPGEGNFLTPNTNTCYIIYTSGTTGKPKGVLVGHQAAVNLCSWHNRYYNVTEKDRTTQIANIGFDASIWEIFPYLTAGSSIQIVPDSIKPDAQAVMDFFIKYCITIAFLPTQLCEQFMEIDGVGEVVDKQINPALRALLAGGDKLNRFTPRKYKLYNNYGPTENTVVTTSFEVNSFSPNIPIGKPIDNTRIFILDKHSNLQPIGVPGELCISGESLAHGYLNRPEITAEKFIPLTNVLGLLDLFDLFKKSKLNLYLSGDLVRWLPDGNIEFLGRIDSQVKIRGFRIELGEIENRLLSHEKVKDTVVTIRENRQGDKYIIAYYISSEKLDETLLKTFLAKDLPSYMIPSYMMQIEKIPLNASGKVDRKALPVPELKHLTEYCAPTNEVEEKLTRLWSDILNVDDKIGIDHNFFLLGGHSLKATMLVSRIHKELDVKIPLAEFFNFPTIRSLAEYIMSQTHQSHKAISSLEGKDYYPLSSAQKRLFILNRIDSQGTGYNIPFVSSLEGEIDHVHLKNIFWKLIKRHESFRTSFHLMDDFPVQIIHNPSKIHFDIEYHEANSDNTRTVISKFIRAFDLSIPPLFRVGLIKIDLTQYILMVDMHHIISDGSSIAVLVNDFLQLYQGVELPPLHLQYRDYAGWQNRFKQQESMKKQEVFWLSEFAEDIPVLEMPADFTRPPVQRFDGDKQTFEVDSTKTRALINLSDKETSTLYMILLSVFSIFLSKLSNQDDIVIGTPAAGRNHFDLEKMIGMFVNTLAIRLHPEGTKSFHEFLLEVKEKTLEVFDNQDYQYDELVEKVVTVRDISRNPLFDVMFSMQNIDIKEIKIPGLTFSPIDYENTISKFDLVFSCTEVHDKLLFTVEYATRLFKPETITRFIDYFINTISAVIENASAYLLLSDIDVLSFEEKKKILVDFNNSDTNYPFDKTLHGLYEDQVARTPDCIAVIGPSLFRDYLPVTGNEPISNLPTVQITYRELNGNSNRLARELIEYGAGPDTVVALIIERSIEMVTGMMGILKAGGAYLPISTGIPAKRKEYFMKDSGASIIVTATEGKKEVRKLGSEEVGILKTFQHSNAPSPDSDQLKTQNPKLKTSSSQDTSYIIYTSGSTGIPKGVMVEHRNAVNVVQWFGRTYRLNTETRVMQMSEYTFDPSVNQVFGTLHFGAAMVIVSRETLLNISSLRKEIERNRVNIINFVPLALNELLTNGPKLKSLSTVLCGGERLDESIKDSILALGYELFNQYGPTETTIDALVDRCSHEKVSLGNPISNVRCYILDKNYNPVPIGVSGELFIAGAGVARGYLNRPEMTAERFFPTTNILGLLDLYELFKINNFKLYLTGDLTRWLPNGKIEFLGRIDSQVKVRGYRIELGEIEARLLSYKSIKEAVVILRKNDSGENYIAAYIVFWDEVEIPALISYLSEELPEYMIPSYIIPIERIPLMPNGKINRNALPEPELKNECSAPRNSLEEKLIELWSGILGIEKNKIGIDNSFFQLGGHSLKATVMISGIHRLFNVVLPLSDVFKYPTIRGLSEILSKSVKQDFSSISPCEKKEYYPLSSAQERLYFMQQKNPESKAYNIPSAILIQGIPDIHTLETAVKEMINRHVAFRTSFQVVGQNVVQRIHDMCDIQFSVEFINDLQQGIHVFDLNCAPLMRISLLKNKEDEHVMVIDIHHIISDGLSMIVFFNELIQLYSGSKLPSLNLQYVDFSEWMKSPSQVESTAEQEKFWLNKYAGEIPLLNIPTDYSRPMFQDFEGAHAAFEVDEKGTGKLKSFVLEERCTIFISLLAVYNIMLSKLSGKEDIIIGTTTNGRRHADLENIIGMFVNTLALRNFPVHTKTFREFLKEVAEQTIQAFDNQDYQFDDLVENLDIQRIPGRNPMFDVTFEMNNIDYTNIRLPQLKGLTFKTFPFSFTPAKFDLSFTATEREDKIIIDILYNKKLFTPTTIEKYIDYFKRILDYCLNSPDSKISGIQLVSETFQKSILSQFNDDLED